MYSSKISYLYGKQGKSGEVDEKWIATVSQYLGKISYVPSIHYVDCI